MPLICKLSLVVRLLLFSALHLPAEPGSPFPDLNAQRATLSQICEPELQLASFPGERARVNWLVRPCSCFEKHICTYLYLPKTSSRSVSLQSTIVFPFWKKLWKMGMKIKLCFNQGLFIPTGGVPTLRIFMDGMGPKQKPSWTFGIVKVSPGGTSQCPAAEGGGGEGGSQLPGEVFVIVV